MSGRTGGSHAFGTMPTSTERARQELSHVRPCFVEDFGAFVGRGSVVNTSSMGGSASDHLLRRAKDKCLTKIV